MSQIGTVIVGMGYWGPKVARNVHLHPQFTLLGVADLAKGRAQEALRGFGSEQTPVFASHSELFALGDASLAIIATPPATHSAIALDFMQAGLNVLIEKPVGLNLEEKKKLVAFAKERGVQVFVDHTYLFTSEFSYVEQVVKNNELGKLNYYLSTRVNLGLLQSDISVVEDLAIHDIAILDALLGTLPKSVACHGIIVEPSTQVSSAFLTLNYSKDFMAQISVSWNSPVKVREIQISGTKGMLLWDDTSGSDKVKIFNSTISKKYTDEDFRISYHIGEGRIPSIPATEAIKNELNYISAQLASPKQAFVSGSEHILRTGIILEALIESLKNSGNQVRL
jgi:predicted dehydrogenase